MTALNASPWEQDNPFDHTGPSSGRRDTAHMRHGLGTTSRLVTEAEWIESVEWCKDHAEDVGQAKAAAWFEQEMRKVVKAQCRQALEKTGLASTKAEDMAYAQPAYIAQLKKASEAIAIAAQYDLLERYHQRRAMAWHTEQNTLNKLNMR